MYPSVHSMERCLRLHWEVIMVLLALRESSPIAAALSLAHDIRFVAASPPHSPAFYGRRSYFKRESKSDDGNSPRIMRCWWLCA